MRFEGRKTLLLSGGLDWRHIACRLAALGIDFDAETWTGNKKDWSLGDDVGAA
jgi:hypothetical protein